MVVTESDIPCTYKSQDLISIVLRSEILNDVQGVPSARLPRLGLLRIWEFHCLPGTAWAYENLAEVPGQLDKMVEQTSESQPNPGARADGTTCIGQGSRSAIDPIASICAAGKNLQDFSSLPQLLRGRQARHHILTEAPS